MNPDAVKMAETRFWKSVNKTESCWLWNKHLTAAGYGGFWCEKTVLAHRYSVILHGTEIPNGMFVDHMCRVRSCVNPAHLRVVTVKENTLCGVGPSAMAAKRTKCPKGHAYTYRWRNERHCKICHREHFLRFVERNPNYYKQRCLSGG